MTAVPTYPQVTTVLDRFGRRRIKRLLRRTRRKGGPFSGDLILALGIRETNLDNIVGDGGHGRGIFQIDDRYHAAWLGKVRGALSGTWKAVVDSALRSGYVPVMMAALGRARRLLTENLKYIEAQGYHGAGAVRAAVSAYNAGAGGAVNGLKDKNDADAYTTGGDYAEWVFEVRRMVRNYLSAHDL